jgi:hypothetical protein
MQDHGQLPPVKDKRCFDFGGVRHLTPKLRGKLLSTAPKWPRRGIEAYEAFKTVFFLDRIERVSQSDDAREAVLLEEFRDLQLRVRDGELTEKDYAFMKEHMAMEGREAEFAGPETYKLVTTQAARDEKNTLEFEAALERGIPSVAIPAINSGAVAAAADDEDMGNLTNELHLCLGARVMINRNLCVAHGLCNGTIGNVHDIVVNDKGFVEAIVLKVRRATPTQDGYKGPAFREGDNGVDQSKEVLVAVNRRSSEIWADGGMQERQQFPLMLAWALTIHKAQGLTLQRVVIDAGDDEASIGLLFVAMTRVRHPKHIAFSPWPGLARVTSVIAKKPKLWMRKRHEVELRTLAVKTAKHLGQPQPLPPAKKPVGPESPALSRLFPTLTGASKPGVSPQTGRVPSTRPQPLNPSPHRHLPLTPSVEKRKRSSATGKAHTAVKAPTAPQKRLCLTTRNAGQMEFDTNTAAITSLGLPRLVVPARSPLAPCPTLPQALTAARHAGLVLEARVVDFWLGSQGIRAAICSWLRDLGFEVTVTADRVQIGVSCGYVAARATNLMFAADDQLLAVEVGDAADQTWIDLGNALLVNGETTESVFLETQHVYALTQLFRVQTFPHEQGPSNNENAWPCQQWPLTVGSLDWVARKISDELMGFVTGGEDPFRDPMRAFFVTNTQDCRQGGSHWISVAISMKWVWD